ncbi:MAG TPA: transcription termination/antitermination NusG family protein [Blastocatellia bacterium]|nr:transcription termination/antitermination NusG family protein [Blastocatellia bacterium]
MTLETSKNELCWYVIHTNPRQEDRADSNLRAWGVETFSPRLMDRRFNPYTGKPTCLVKPLFQGYIFARFQAEDYLHKVRFTRGVQCVITSNGEPVPVEDEIIATIRSRMGADGLIRLGEALKPGDEVVIKDGPLKDFTAIFEREMKDADRVMILLKTVSYQAHYVISREFVKKARTA